MYNYLINFRPVLLGAPLQFGAHLVRLWVNPALRLDGESHIPHIPNDVRTRADFIVLKIRGANGLFSERSIFILLRMHIDRKTRPGSDALLPWIFMTSSNAGVIEDVVTALSAVDKLRP